MKPVLPAPPASQAPPAIPDPQLPRFSRGAALAAILAGLPLVATALLIGTPASLRDFILRDDDSVGVVFALCGGAAFVGAIIGITVTGSLSRTVGEVRGRWLAILSIPLGFLMTGYGALVALAATADFTRGRQLRERGRAVFAKLVPNDTWLETPPSTSTASLAPAGVADAWRENGKTEHASVGAFAKLAADLVALGAPAALVEDAHRDALDEIAHARLCFSLARDLDGQTLEPGALPAARAMGLRPLTRTTALARLAVDSLIDGALNEGTSARAVARLAKQTHDPAIRRVLVAIAGDEGRHAHHGWLVLGWCLAQGGVAVEHALRGALRSLPERMGASLVDEADDGRWERWGLPGRALLDESYAAVRADVVARLETLLARREVRAPRAA